MSVTYDRGGQLREEAATLWVRRWGTYWLRQGEVDDVGVVVDLLQDLDAAHRTTKALHAADQEAGMSVLCPYGA